MKQPIQSLLSTVGMGDECGHGSFLTLFLIKQNFLYIIDDVRTAAVAAV